jgi:hypothetical protein
MAKITLEFDSTEEEEARTALDGGKWKSVLWDLDQELRNISKYGSYNGKEATNEEMDIALSLRVKICDMLRDYSLNLD